MSIYFFNPVYVRPSKETNAIKPTLWENWVVNSAEFVFHFHKETYIITPKLAGKSRLITDFPNKNSLLWNICQTISLIAVIIFFPIGLCLLKVKFDHHKQVSLEKLKLQKEEEEERLLLEPKKIFVALRACMHSEISNIFKFLPKEMAYAANYYFYIKPHEKVADGDLTCLINQGAKSFNRLLPTIMIILKTSDSTEEVAYNPTNEFEETYGLYTINMTIKHMTAGDDYSLVKGPEYIKATDDLKTMMANDAKRKLRLKTA